MQLEQRSILVSGANRGIGKAIVEELLKQPVKKVYAAARHLDDLIFSDSRVVPVALDITNRTQIDAAVAKAGDISVLINNAGVLSFAGVVTGEPDMLMRDMEVNYFGTLSMVRAFAPVIEKNGGGAIANVSSVVGLAPMASIGGYSASKAALFSATLAMRAELKPKHISVYGIFPGPIDTDMAKEFPMTKATPESAAEQIIKGIVADEEYIFPDPISSEMGKLWLKDPQGLERQFAKA